MDANHYVILKTEKFLVKLHDLLNLIISIRGFYHEGLHQVITNLIYLFTLLNKDLGNKMKKILISDCRLKMKQLDNVFNPDLLQMIYFDLALLNKIVQCGSKDQELFQLLMDLAEINVAEVHLYLIRFCIEKEWDYEFYVQ